MRELLIACDLDGVVADFDRSWVEAYNEQFGTDLKPRSQNKYHMLLEGTEFETIEEWWVWFHTKVGFGNLEPVVGAIDGLIELKMMGHQVFYITSRPRWCQADSMNWLDKHGVPFGAVLCTPDKSKGPYMIEDVGIKPDVWIEDSPHELAGLHAMGENWEIIVHDMPWNVGTAYGWRALSWPHIVDRVKEIANGTHT